jgi:hypothetical protein
MVALPRTAADHHGSLPEINVSTTTARRSSTVMPSLWTRQSHASRTAEESNTGRWCSRTVSLRGAAVLCIVGGAALSSSACSGSGPEGSEPESCVGGCEQQMLSGPHIQVAQGSTALAAIEILNPQAPDGGSAGGCGVHTWSGEGIASATYPPVDFELVCPAYPQDAGWASETCAARYPCMPSGNQLDGGASCTSAWIRMSAPFGSSSRCSITVISVMGERQTFEAEGAWATWSYHCRTGLGECIEITPFSAYPSQVTVTFAPAAGGRAEPDGGGAVDGAVSQD